MDPYTALMSMEDIPEDQLRVLAAQLRGRAATGGQLSSSTIAPVQEQARLMQTEANQQAGNIGLQQYRKKQMEEDRLARDEDRKAQVLVAAMRAAGKGRGGSDWVNKPSASALTKFEDEAKKVGSLDMIRNTFDPSYVGSLPMSGLAENWLTDNVLGRAAPEGMRRQSEWWRNFNRFYTNIERHELFGSALTAAEQSAWKASNVGPDATAEEVARAMETLDSISKKLAAKSALNALNKNYDPEYVYDNYADVLPREVFTDRDTLRAYVESLSTRLGTNPKAVGDMTDEELLEAARAP